MRALIVGGSGFVGRYVVRRLAAAGAEVFSVDRREPADPVPGERVLVLDVGAPTAPGALAAFAGPVDAVVWLAAVIRHRYGVDETVAEDLRLGVEAPLRLLGALAPAPRSLVYFSSIQVYGHPQHLPVAENHPTDPFTAYGVAKLCGEHVLRTACERRGTAFAALRVAFVFGPGQPATNVLQRFIAQVRRGEAPVVHGAGGDLRDDVFVEDVADAVWLAIERGAHGAFNVASGRPHTIRDVAEAVCRLGPPGLHPRHDDEPSTWVDRTFAADLAREAFGFVARTTFAAGLRRMWPGGGAS